MLPYNGIDLGTVHAAPIWEDIQNMIRSMWACKDPPAMSPASPAISLLARAPASLMLFPHISPMPRLAKDSTPAP